MALSLYQIDPLLYDALIRKFQSSSESQGEAQAKGYSRILEGDLMRAEAKLAKLTEKYAQQHLEDDTSTSMQSQREGHQEPPSQTHFGATTQASQREATEALELDPPKTKEEAQNRWQEFLQLRFVRGEDDDFDYEPVDRNETLDVMEVRDDEEKWFDEETPGWASEGSNEGSVKQERILRGETGVQDF